MRVRKSIKILFFFIMIIFINGPVSKADSEIVVISNKDNIQINEDVEIKINISNTNIASCTLELYFDNDIFEYISGPENSNNSNGRIVYTWVSETGENKSNVDVGTFVFCGNIVGVSNIVVTGEFYNSEGNQVDLANCVHQIKVSDNAEDGQFDESNLLDNTNLKALRINQEGISPDFSPSIKEYYFIADKSIDNLDVTAIPENENAVVTVTGNNNFKIGKNTINIIIGSEDKSKTDVYKIYVTKTENIETANANLETFAVSQATLNPEFNNNVTQYKVEVSNDVDKIDILAIPQKENATVKIVGNNEMQIGLNKVEIVVIAEDGITDKKYVLNVYRRSKEEEMQVQEEQKVEAKVLANILEEKENKIEQNSIEENDKNEISTDNEYLKNHIGIVVWVIIGVGVIIGIIFYIIKLK